MTIWKYPLQGLDSQQIEMPIGARVLCVQTQAGIPCIWALVNPLGQLKPRRILVVGTGHNANVHAAAYIGTFQLRGGLVFHVFEDPS